MSLKDWIDDQLKGAKTEAERKKAIEEGTLRALWEIKNLLEMQTPPSEEISSNNFLLPYNLALTNKKLISAAGNIISYRHLYYVSEGAESNRLPIYIRLDDENNPEIILFPGEILYAPFKRFYVTVKSVVGRWIMLTTGYNIKIESINYTYPFRQSGSEYPLPALIDSDLHLQTDVLSLPSLPAGTNNIGDVDVLTLPAITGTVTTLHGKTLKSAVINCAASGDNTIISAVAGKQLTIYAIAFNVEGTVNVTLKDGAATAKSGVFTFQAREGLTWAVTPPGFLFQGTTNTAFIINLSAAIGIDGIVSYWEE